VSELALRDNDTTLVNHGSSLGESNSIESSSLGSHSSHSSHSSIERSRHSVTVLQCDVAAARAGFVPSALRDIPLQASAVGWADIGGLHAVRATLRETLEMPTRYGGGAGEVMSTHDGERGDSVVVFSNERAWCDHH
jgi:SpoVK/Ycf46/Vps4 family AAA+-type ATPase